MLKEIGIFAGGITCGYIGKKLVVHIVTQCESRGEQRGVVKMKAEYAVESEIIAAKVMAEDARHFEELVTLASVGYAYAANNDHLTDETRKKIDKFIGGVAAHSVPEHIHRQLDELFRHPPGIEAALASAKMLEPGLLTRCDAVIKFTKNINSARLNGIGNGLSALLSRSGAQQHSGRTE